MSQITLCSSGTLALSSSLKNRSTCAEYGRRNVRPSLRVARVGATAPGMGFNARTHMPHMREEEGVVLPHKRSDVRGDLLLRLHVLMHVAQIDKELNDAE